MSEEYRPIDRWKFFIRNLRSEAPAGLKCTFVSHIIVEHPENRHLLSAHCMEDVLRNIDYVTFWRDTLDRDEGIWTKIDYPILCVWAPSNFGLQPFEVEGRHTANELLNRVLRPYVGYDPDIMQFEWTPWQVLLSASCILNPGRTRGNAHAIRERHREQPVPGELSIVDPVTGEEIPLGIAHDFRITIPELGSLIRTEEEEKKWNEKKKSKRAMGTRPLVRRMLK